jgi:hypothetical protein
MLTQCHAVLNCWCLIVLLTCVHRRETYEAGVHKSQTSGRLGDYIFYVGA